MRRHHRRHRRPFVLVAVLAMLAALVPVGASFAVPPDDVVFDDMEHGDPFGNGWFSSGGGVGGGGIAVSNDTPDGSAFSLETGWGSGGNPGFFGVFGRTFPVDVSATDTFSFWINPVDGQDYTLEVNLQEDDEADGAVEATANDDEFQYDCVVSPTGPCAVAGGGWQLVQVPLADFFDDNSFFTMGNGVLDPAAPANGGNGELFNVVFAVIGNTGSDVNFETDHWRFTAGAVEPPPLVVDDFEDPLANGTDGDGNTIGFFTFSDGSPVSVTRTDAPPAPVPGADAGNDVLCLTGDVTAFAGYIHAFENAAVDTWVSQDWTRREGVRFWFHGDGTGTDLFFDLIDNRNPGSTTDDGERFTVTFVDDVAGWRQLEFPFSAFARKEIGNGAPNDGLGLTQVWGYAIGTLATAGEQTFYVDDVELYGEAGLPPLQVNFSQALNFVPEGTTGDIAVKLNRPMGSEDPAQVSVDYRTEPADATPFEEYTPTSGTLTFVNGGPTELTFPFETFDDTKFEGDERVVIRLVDPVDVERGPLFQGSAFVADDDPFDPLLLGDFERGAYLWDSEGLLTHETMPIMLGGPDERPGQDAAENALAVHSPLDDSLRMQADDIVAALDALIDQVAPSTNRKRLVEARARIMRGIAESSLADTFADPTNDAFFNRARQAVIKLRQVGGAVEPQADAIAEDVGALAIALATNAAIVLDGNGGDNGQTARMLGFADQATSPQQAVQRARNVWRRVRQLLDARDVTWLGSVGRDLAKGEDWSAAEAVSFWFRGNGTGEDIAFTLKDNRAPDPGPGGWEMTWSDEFNLPAGTPPLMENWRLEIGDATPDGKNGWGNEERQYYTDDPANAAHDGDGNLVLTLREADGSRECYYGPCEYTSARLLTQDRAEFAYGRIESRLKVPAGQGLWPAFWSLGTDIRHNPWPAAGEIDFMEFVGRLPNEIFGTIHGPGYAGGASFGNVFDFGTPVPDDYHTYTVEWEPNEIRWFVDGIMYHSATPADVAPNPWVFEKPFFFLLNLAIGGNFGGAIGDDVVYPADYLVDYVRVYSAPDTAERFTTTFVDDTDGWKQVTIPFADLVRDGWQPPGAPDDGLGLTDVWGFELGLPLGAGGKTLVDLVQLELIPPPTDLVVTNTNDAGDGSLRDAIARIAPGGDITFDPSLAGGTITLTSGQLLVDRNMTIDGSGAPGIVVSGGNASRVVQVAPAANATITDLDIADGAGAGRGGGVLNLGALTLERVTVRDNTETSGGGPAFDLGGGGIYNGDGATLNLTDSTVTGNATTTNPGGGVYGFFNTTLNITDSTISNNVAADVAGGLRTLGNATIVGSVITGNTSTAWHGGGIFATDGVVTIEDSEITDNIAPTDTAGGLMVAVFGPTDVTVTLENTIVTGNVDRNCEVFVNGGGSAQLQRLGGNTIDDDTCGPPPPP